MQENSRPVRWIRNIADIAVIVLIVVAFPKGIVGMWDTLRNRRRPQAKSALLASRIETAE